MSHVVGLTRSSQRDLKTSISEVLGLSGCLSRIRAAKNVVIKPNLVTDKEEYIHLGANTSMEVLEALLALLSDFSCKTVIGESDTGTPAKGRRLDLAWRRMGLDRLAQRYGCNLANFTHEPSTEIEIPGSHRRTVPFPIRVLECDLLLNVPKIKTHKYAVLTCSMKNLFGLVPEPRRVIYHRFLHEIISALAVLLNQKTVTLVDGLIGMEGNGPLYGDPVDLGLLLAGKNLWAIDRTVCDLIGIAPDRVRYLRLAEKTALSEDRDIRIEGIPLEECRRKFKPVEFSLYRSFEKKLMESPLVHIVTSHWFQRYVSSHFAGLTQRLRGGGYSWYLDE